MTRPTILGVDLSLTATGICDDDGPRVLELPARASRGMPRLDWIRDAIPHTCALVVVEGYSFGSHSAQAHANAELGGLIRWTWWCQGIPYVEVPPKTAKKFATNNGNAGKDAMVATAARLGCPADDNNAVDAWWLYQMGLYHYLTPEVPVTAYRSAVVDAIDWPALLSDDEIREATA